MNRTVLARNCFDRTLKRTRIYRVAVFSLELLSYVRTHSLVGFGPLANLVAPQWTSSPHLTLKAGTSIQSPECAKPPSPCAATKCKFETFVSNFAAFRGDSFWVHLPRNGVGHLPVTLNCFRFSFVRCRSLKPYAKLHHVYDHNIAVV